MPFTVEQAGRFYRIECIDYGKRAGEWLLVGAGTGLMMSVMDQEPRLRYCLDTDIIIRTPAWSHFADWLQLMERACGRVIACGWFSRYANGLPLIEALTVLQKRPLVYFGGYERPDLLAHCDVAVDVGEFVARLNALDRHPPNAKRTANRNRRIKRHNVRETKVPA